MPEKMNRVERSRSRSCSRRSVTRSATRSRSRSSGRRRRSITPDRRKRSRSRYSRDSRRRSRSHSKISRRNRGRHSCSKSRSYSPHEHKSYDRRKSYSRSPLSQRRRHLGTREHPKQSRCLGVFGLSIYTTEQRIYQIFSKFGPIERVQVVIDAKTGKSRGFCFVYFESLEDAKVAKDECCGMEIDDRRIRVDYSITQRAHTPTPGIYMGKPTKYYRERAEYHDRLRDESSHKDKSRYRERNSPSPHYNDRRRRYDRSRSRSYTPRDRRYR